MPEVERLALTAVKSGAAGHRAKDSLAAPSFGPIPKLAARGEA